MESLLLHPWFHHFTVLLHASAGLFWMGWIVFIFFLLIPTLQERIPDEIRRILPALKHRIRRVVFWMILVILVTGSHNVYYTGLYQPDVLLGTGLGHRFLVKLGAALVLFSVYLIAPHLTGGSDGPESSNWMMVVLHVLAFSAGMTAALLGFSLGG